MDRLGAAILNSYMYYRNAEDMFSDKNPHNCIKYVDQTLKHYTQPNIAALILNSRKIRLSKINEMRNDITEGNYVWDVFWMVCRELLDDGEITENFYDSLKKHLWLQWAHPFQSIGRTVDCDVYVACFTGKVDDEALFDRYGPCAIQFGPMLEYLTDTLTPMVKECIELCKVIYNPSIFNNYLRRVILEPFKAANVNQWPRIYTHLNSVLSRWSCLVKSPYWDNEKENRLLFYLPKNEKYRRLLLDECPDITEDEWEHIMVSIKPILGTTFVLSRKEQEITQIIAELDSKWDCIDKGPLHQSPFFQYHAVLKINESESNR